MYFYFHIFYFIHYLKKGYENVKLILFVKFLFGLNGL